MKIRDKFRGCLLGGAAGDALGYAVEFYSVAKIFRYFGPDGITEYELKDGAALISDDTQMTLFTADALLWESAKDKDMETCLWNISDSYKEWLETQSRKYQRYDWMNADQEEESSFLQSTMEILKGAGKKYKSKLMEVPELYQLRAPGNTCMSAIEKGAGGTMEQPINDSKGCGGVMRVAPIGLYFKEGNYTLKEIDLLGAKAAALTHGHELGYIPAAGLVHLVSLLTYKEDITVLDAVLDLRKTLAELFSGKKYLSRQLELIDLAIRLSQESENDLEAIAQLGEGWVAEETLAIAIYCALKYPKDFDKAIIASVNHDGDSDSTGAVTGNILGAYLGLERIPQKYKDNLELKDVILRMADELYEKRNV